MSASRIVNFSLSLQQVVTTTSRSKELQNLPALRGEISDLFVSCHNHQMDRLKALKYPAHSWGIGQLTELIGEVKALCRELKIAIEDLPDEFGPTGRSG